MTEDEAKTKWCPFSRITGATESHHAMDNRGDPVDAMRVPGLCLGSACMAWRGSGDVMFRDARTGKITDRDLTGHGQWVQTQGFCGMVGAQ